MARQMSAEEYQELGRSFYKLKQYDKALETFTKGIENCPKPTLNLYDYRAATYDKLERFNDAVKDGREMIKLNKTDVKGYLRTGNVLEKMGKEETALGIYKYGMKNISSKDKNFKVLQQLHDKLTRKLSPAESVDPFSVLPKELAEMVLGYLSFRQMVSCMRVSKGWHTYLSRLPKLWMHLDLRSAKRPVSRSFVNSAFKYSDLRMTSVTLHRFAHMDVIRNLAKAAKGLAEIEIISLPHFVSESLIDIVKNAPNLKKLVVHADTTEDSMEQIFAARPELEHFAFHSLSSRNHPLTWAYKTLSHLHTLSLRWDKSSEFDQDIDLSKLLRLTPSLRTLSLFNVTPHWGMHQNSTSEQFKLPPLIKLVLKRIIYIEVFPLPATLQHLEIENINGMPSTFPNDPHHTESPLSNLTHLSLSGFPINAERLGWILDVYRENGSIKSAVDAKPLQHLSLAYCWLADHDATLLRGFNNILCQSPRILTPALESLDIGTLPCNDDDVEQLLTVETGISDINLSDTKVTGASVKMLVDKLPKLKHIHVGNCARISGRDAIDYAERKGVSVSYRMGEQKGGKKIRYG